MTMVMLMMTERVNLLGDLADNVPELDQLVLAHTAASKSAVVDVELKQWLCHRAICCDASTLEMSVYSIFMYTAVRSAHACMHARQS